MKHLERDFFARDAVTVARALVGKRVCHRTPEGTFSLLITETEAYWGTSDTACHAHKGRSKRTEMLYCAPGTAYVYLCYGIHWLANVVTGAVDDPQAVLLRAGMGAKGPGLLTRALKIDGSLNGSDFVDSGNAWFEEGVECEIIEQTRVGISYAAPEDRERLWRFVMK